MSNQIVISSGAKVRSLEGVLTGTAGIVNSVPLGGANGVATLDSLGKVPLSQLPASVVTYLGTWNAATNTPTLTNGVGDVGDLYICNVAGTVNFGAGPITFAVGDWVIYSGTEWQKSSGASGTVTSVAVTESGDALTITGSPITTSGTINIGFAGTGSQYIKGDGTLATFPTTIDQAKRLITEVYNSTGATLSKGTVVYINGGQGNLPTVTKAQANADNTSAQTYGVVQSDITNMNNGFVVVFGSLTDLDTQAYAVGTQLYLSGTTAGAWTSTKPSAPIHLVYVGIVVRSHPTQGVVEIRIQNGYELEELHDVAISAPVNNQGIFYNSSNDLWENKSIATALGYTPANDALVVHLAGTETITGSKIFSAAITADAGISLKEGVVPSAVGYTGLAGDADGLLITKRIGTTAYTNLFYFQAIDASNTYTYPNLSGTIALLEGTQTFSGNKTFSALTAFTFLNGTRMDYGLYLSKGSVPSAFSGSTVNLYSDSGNNNLVVRDNSNTSLLQFQAASSYTYTFPAASGSLALLESTQTFTGDKTFNGGVDFNNALNINNTFNLRNNLVGSTDYTNFSILKSGSLQTLTYLFSTANSSKLVFNDAANYTYTFPTTSGTLALTSNLSSYVPYTGATSAVDLGNYSLTTNNFIYAKAIQLDAGVEQVGGTVIFRQRAGISGGGANYTTIGAVDNNKLSFGFWQDAPSGVNRYKFFQFRVDNITISTSRVYQMPDADGTIALTSDLGAYLPLSGGTLTGALNGTSITLTNDIYLANNKFLYAKKFSGATSYSLIGINTSDKVLIDGSGMGVTFGGTIGNGTYTYTLPSATGTIALTSNLSSYLPLTGGTLTGALSGTSATFNTNSTSNAGFFQINDSTTTLGNSFATVQRNANDGNGRFSLSRWQVQNTSGLEQSAFIGAQAVTGASNYSPNLILGVSNGASSYTTYLTIASTGAATFSSSVQIQSSNGIKLNRSANDYYWQINSDSSNYLNFGSYLANGTAYGTNPKMILLDNGNVGIGTSIPQTLLHLASSSNTFLTIDAASASNSGLTFYKSGAAAGAIYYLGASDAMRFDTANTERMRITSGGDVYIGNSTISTANTAIFLQKSGIITTVRAYSSGTIPLVEFYKQSAGDIGSISYNGTNTLYNSTSDYRLKEDLKDYNAIEIIGKLKTYDFKWKDTDVRDYGMMAHELQEVLPNYVTGEKDAENEDGSIKPQGVDYSKIVPVLVKAIQEQQEIINNLSAKVTALENK